MKLSIIVPVYKTEKTLRRCVDSILSQTFTDYELLLVDDGSPDSSGAMADGMATRDGRIRVMHKANGGLSDARNYGLDRCRGEYVAFVDSDDALAPHTLDTLMDIVSSHPEYDILEFPVLERHGRPTSTCSTPDARPTAARSTGWLNTDLNTAGHGIKSTGASCSTTCAFLKASCMKTCLRLRNC